MQITDRVYLIRQDFNVTPVVKRYVNIYLIVGEKGCYLIDSGVAGAEVLIKEYLQSLGKSMADIKGLFLTHSHPDHIGAAKRIKQESNCTVYAPQKELSWIENINNQFRDRPIPNFYTLLPESVQVDVAVEDGMIVEPEKGIQLKCVETMGHSHGSMSYMLNGEEIFIGDAVPVVNDIPIFVDYRGTIKSIQLLQGMQNIAHYCPAWDDVYNPNTFAATSQASLEMLAKLKAAADAVAQKNPDKKLVDKVSAILQQAGLLQFAGNPLVIKSIEACLQA